MRARRCNWPKHSCPNGIGLVFTVGHQDNLFRLHNTFNTHGNSLSGDFFPGGKEAGIILNRTLGQSTNLVVEPNSSRAR